MDADLPGQHNQTRGVKPPWQARCVIHVKNLYHLCGLPEVSIFFKRQSNGW